MFHVVIDVNLADERPLLVGSNKCTWGPAYWCDSAANAKECGLEEDGCARYGGIKNT